MRELTKDERIRRMEILEEGKKSEHWKILKEYLDGLRIQEMKYLDSFKFTGMNEEKIRKYNESVLRLEGLDRFLNINEEITEFEKTWLDRIGSYADEIIRKVESFVK